MTREDTVNDGTPTKSHPSFGIMLALAAQHVIVLFSGIILVPVMLVNIYDFDTGDAHYLIFATSICAAVTTLLQLVRGKRFGLGLPMFMGTSAAYMSSCHSAIQLGGPALLSGMILISAPFQVLFSYLIRFMRHILTPTVGGIIIMLAMVGLLKDSIATWTHGDSLNDWPAAVDILTGASTVMVMLAVEWFGGKRLRPWGLPLGIAAGCLIALGMGVRLSPDLSSAPWFGLPSGKWSGLAFSPEQGSHWALVFTFVLAVLATSIKYAGDAMVLQRVADPKRRKVNYDALQGGLYANSVGLFMAGACGGMPASSHSPNIPLMEMTGVATRRVAALGAVLLALVALSPKMLLMLIHIPQSVIGGVGVVLVAHLFSAGMQLVASEMNHRNGLIAGLSLCIGLTAVSGNFFPEAFPADLDPLVKNGVALGGLAAVLLTIITRLSTEKSIRIAVRPTMADMLRFKDKLCMATDKLGLDNKEANYLELACEEVFLYMREECRDKKFGGRISFTIRREKATLAVEASGGTRFASEADEIAERGSQGAELLGDAELNSMGLALVAHFAEKVSHVTIAGYTYIGFSLPIET